MAKSKVIKPMATKKLVRNRKPSGPARPRESLESSTGMRCEGVDCGRPATVFHRWRWWCQRCDPGDKPDPACTHSQPSRVLDVIMCSFCGGTLPEGNDEP